MLSHFGNYLDMKNGLVACLLIYQADQCRDTKPCTGDIIDIPVSSITRENSIIHLSCSPL